MIKNDKCENNADEPFAITMEQDLGQALMNDLCARLPYGVIVLDEPAEQRGKLWSVSHDYMVSYESDVSEELERQSIFNIRCYLRPMSSMTKEETKYKLSNFFKIIDTKIEGVGYIPTLNSISAIKYIDWLNKNHFDYRGLISMGLALEAPEDMYKTE